MDQATADISEVSDQATAGADTDTTRASEADTQNVDINHATTQGADAGSTTTVDNILSGDKLSDPANLASATEALLAELDSGVHNVAKESKPPVEPTEPATQSEAETQEDTSAATELSQDGDEAKPTKPYRLRPTNHLDDEVFRQMREDPLIGVEEATAKAREKLGLATPAPSTSEASPGDTEGQQSETVTQQEDNHQSSHEVAEQIRTLQQESLDALENDYDHEAYASGQREIIRLQALQAELRESEKQEHVAYDAAVTASQKIVTNKNPEVLKPDSPIAKRMAQIDEAWGEADDDRYFDPRKAETIYAIVAKEFNLTDGTSTSDSPSREPVPKSALPASPKGQPAIPTSGGTRTTTSTGQGEFKQKLDSVKTVSALESLTQEFLASLPA